MIFPLFEKRARGGGGLVGRVYFFVVRWKGREGGLEWFGGGGGFRGERGYLCISMVISFDGCMGSLSLKAAGVKPLTYFLSSASFSSIHSFIPIPLSSFLFKKRRRRKKKLYTGIMSISSQPQPLNRSLDIINHLQTSISLFLPSTTAFT